MSGYDTLMSNYVILHNFCYLLAVNIVEAVYVWLLYICYTKDHFYSMY